MPDYPTWRNRPASLAPAGANQYTFFTDHWVSISTNVDVEGQTGLATLLGSDRLELSDRYAAQNLGQPATLGQLAGGDWRIHVPVDASVFISTGDTPLGPVFIVLNVNGDLVGHSFTPPPNTAVIASQPGNDSLETAQLVTGFARHFDPDIGDAVINTSAAIPHVTIEAIGDGTFDFYSFDVVEPASIAYFDIDHATFDSELFLFDAFGNLLAQNDDAPYNIGAGGSSSSLDAFLEYTFLEPGRYTIAVTQYDTIGVFGGLIGSGPPVGSEYTLHISVAYVPEPPLGAVAVLAFAGAMLFAARRRRLNAAPVLALAACVMLAAPVASANPLIKDSLEVIYDPGSTRPMPYRLFLPPGLEGSQESFPLVLFMHGAGERGEDNFYQVANNINGLIQATQSDDYAAFLLAPQVTDYPFGGSWNPNSSFDRTMEILSDVIGQYPVDTDRIYLTGLSLGGFGTFTYLAAFPDLFAAGAPIAGGGNTGTAPLIKDIPLWVFHGALDDVVSVNQSRNMVNAITAAGGSPLYTEFPFGDHGVWHQVYSDVHTSELGFYDWLFAQSKAPPAALAVPEPGTLGLGIIGAALAIIAGLRKRRR